MTKGARNVSRLSFRVWASVFALALFPLTGQAVQWNSSTDFVWNASTGRIDTFPGPGSGNMWGQGTKSPTSTGPSWKSPPKALPFNPSPTFNFEAKFTPAQMARGLMKGAALPFLAGSALNELMKEACVRIAGGQMQLAEGGLWEECKFTTQTGMEHKLSNIPTSSGFYAQNTFVPSKETACEKMRAYYAASDSSTTYKKILDTLGMDNAVAGGSCTIRQGQYDSFVASYSFESRTTQVQVHDGWKDTSEANAEGKLKTKLEEWTQRDFLYGYSPNNKDTGDVMDELMAGGRSVESTTSGVASGSQTSIDNPPKTETTTINNTTTTTTTNVTNNYNHSYNPTTNVITITHTTTTTTTNGGTGETKTTTEQKDPEDACKANPDRVGCKTLGTPANETIPTDTKNVTYTAEDLGLGSGSCPGPVSFSTRAGTHNISYAGACNFVETYMRPVALLIGALMALFILMPGKADAT